MTDRTIKTTLLAQVQGYVAGMREAARSTQEVGSEAEKLAKKGEAFRQLGGVLLGVGAAAAAMTALTIVKYAQFDQAMSNANAILQETTDNQKLLSEAALDAGGKTVFTAKQSANAIEELGKAGLGTSDILSGALTGSLDLAASGQLEVARAAEVTGITLKQFALDGTQAGRVADVLSAGANKAVGSVEDLANGMKFVGPVAHGMDISLEDTTATLALFADRGVIGEQAGTSFRGMLSSLTSPSKEAKVQLDSLGVSLYDGSGKFLGVKNVAGELNRALHDTDDASRDAALGIIFGNQQLTAARILVDAGADTWQDYRDAVDDSGIAARVAAERMDNLAGDVEKLGGSIDTALIKTGAAGNDSLRFMVQWATEAADAYSSLPEPLQATAFWTAAVSAAVALGSGVFFLGVPKVAEYTAALATLGPTAQRTGRLLSISLKGISIAGAVLTGISLIDKLLEGLRATDAEIENVVQTSTSGQDAVRKALQGILGAGQAVTDFRGSLDRLGNIDANWWARFWEGPQGAFEVDRALERVGSTLGEIAATDMSAAQEGFRKLAAETDGSSRQLSTLLNHMPGFKDALTTWATNAGLAADDQTLLNIALGVTPKEFENSSRSSKVAADGYLQAAQEAQGLQDTLTQLIDTIMKANGVGQDAISANIDYKNALAEVTSVIDQARAGVDANSDGVADYTITLDENTQAGRDNLSMLLDAAKAGQDAAAAQFALDGNTASYVAALQANRETILQNARDLGATDEQIQFLSDHVVAMPTEKEIRILADTTSARERLDSLIRDYDNRVISVQTLIRQIDRKATGGTVYGFASGGTLGAGGVSNGTVFGPGGPKDDRVIVALSPGEEVVQEPYATRNRALLKAINAGLYGFAAGGTVPDRRYIPMSSPTTRQAVISASHTTLIGEYHAAENRSYDRQEELMAALALAESVRGYGR